MSRLGLVYLQHHKLVEITVRYERYVRGLTALGHDVLTVTPAGTEPGYPYPTHLYRDVADLADPAFWTALGLDAAVVVTWLDSPDVVRAVRAAGLPVTGVTDGDGVVGVRAFPLTLLKRMTAFHTSRRLKLGAAKHWLQLYLYAHRAAAAPRLASADASDRIAVTSPGAAADLGRFFDYYGRGDLSARVVVAPYPVDEEFLTGGVPTSRENRVVAVGRWDDPQKDAGLLAAAVRRALPELPHTEFAVVGRGAEAAFGRLGPRVKLLGVRPPAEVAELLRTSRVLALSSRWESGPIVANEALCTGCSLVGPAWVPTIPWYCGAGPFGTAFARRSPAALAAALVAESRAWDAGRRDPVKTAARWRPVFAPEAACRPLVP